MNHRAGWALIKSTWFSWMQYRSFFFVLAFGWMVPPLVALFVWLAAAGDGSIAGMDRGTFTAYYLTLVIVNQLTYAQANWTLGDMIRVGFLNSWLLRPLAPVYQVLSGEAAGKVVELAFIIPVTAVLALILRPEWSVTPVQVELFLSSLCFAWALRFLWGYWLALLAFWSTRADALLAVQDSLVFLLSGVVAPTALLPGFLQALARYLPFRYMVGFPVEILTQGLPQGELIFGFTVQLVWLAVAVGLSWSLWRLGLRRYTAIGG